MVGIRIRKLHPAAEKYARILEPVTEAIEGNRLKETRTISMSRVVVLPDTTRSHSIGPSWHVVCVFKETTRARGKVITHGHFLLIMGHDGKNDRVRCSTKPCPDSDDEILTPAFINRAREGVASVFLLAFGDQ